MRTAIVESRPTPLDKAALRDFVKALTEDVIVAARDLVSSREPDEEQFVGDNQELLRSSYSVLDVRTREPIEFPVVVRTETASKYVDRGELVVGAGAGVVDGELIVEITINGAYRWQKLEELRSHLTQKLYEAMLHEATHIADHAYDNVTRTRGKPKYYGDDDTIDDELYWNDPREVRAFLQGAVEEALARAESFARARGGKHTREQMLDYVHAGREWKDIEKNMDARNRAKVLKAVYGALVDAGYL